MKYLKIKDNIDFEKYYRKGGEVVIPVEVFNDMIGNWEDLIKYLENKIKIQKSRYEWYLNDFQKNKNEVVMGILKEIQLMIHIYQDVLERVKSGKYE